MDIISYDSRWTAQWTQLFTNYFLEDLDCGLTGQQVQEKICPFILSQQNRGILQIVLAVENDRLFGFSIFQIDALESDWCKRPGWGCIQEFFVAQQFRRQGIGTILAAYTEKLLREMGADSIYLTTDSAAQFWIHCGYHSTGTVSTNACMIFTK